MPRNKTTRSGNHDGSITQRGNSWRGIVMINGRRRSFTAPTKRAVQSLIRTAVAEAEQGLMPAPDKLTLETYLVEWLRDTKQPKLRPNVYRGYCQLARCYLIPSLGKVKLKDLRAAHIQKLYREMSDRGLSAHTVQRSHNVIRGALRHAVETGLVPRNVASLVHPPTPRTEEIQVLDSDQVRQLLDTAAGTRWSTLLHMAVYSQMRIGELLGLRWSEVNFERGTVRVVRQQTDTGAIAEPKTAAGRRTIDLPAKTLIALREHRTAQLEERLQWGADWEDGDLVFCTHRGRPISYRNAVRAFKILLERAGLPEIRFHDLRHTGATWLLSQGVTVNTVAQRLGHADVMVTLRTYAHVLPTMQREAAAKLDELLG